MRALRVCTLVLFICDIIRVCEELIMYLVFTFLLFSVETDYEDESVMETEQSSVEVELQVCGCVHHYNMSKNILCRDGSGKN